MLYIRKVIYLDNMICGERLGSAGFVKVEVRDESCNITIQVNGLAEESPDKLQVYLVAANRESKLCELPVNQRKGNKQLLCQAVHDIGNTGISYDELEAVRMPVAEGREIYGVLDKGTKAAVVKPKQEGQAEVVAAEEAECEKIPEERTEKQSMKMCNNKWEQLWSLYPHISPFQDDRTFISLTPGDFVLLPEKYFKVAHNSFLLHGYYNYRHLILKRLEYRNEVKYYLGVPGNFYDKEKQVAVMFGFESFESLAETAQTGDYGYYLMHVEL